MAKTRSRSQVSRRDVLSAGAMMTGIGVASAAIPSAAFADDGGGGRELAAVGQIYRLQAAFHRAKSTQDIDLMMSLWDSRAALTVLDDPNSPYVGFDRLKAFWQGSGSFTHRRFSLVPSFKIQIDVHGDAASLYFECHDVGDFDLATRQIASDTFLTGTVRRARRGWVFFRMTAGPAFPLSVDHYFGSSHPGRERAWR
jgi:hypothetical protein